jgi:signal transduction histidine kinase
VVSLLPHLRVAVEEALAVLEELGRGIYPRQLADEGIAVALRVATGTSALFVHVEDTTSRRYPQEIEAAAYFAGLEAVQNAVKHSGGSQVCVRLTDGSDGLRLEVSDDGQGFDVEAADAAAGTTHLRDRLEAVGGHVAVVSAPGAGTRVSCWIPVKVREELLA